MQATNAGLGAASALVVRGCGTAEESRSPAEVVAVVARMPALFVLRLDGASGANPVAALRGGGPEIAGDPQQVAGATPARPGEFVSVFATGLGATDPPLPAGAIPAETVPDGLARVTGPVVVRIGNREVPTIGGISVSVLTGAERNTRSGPFAEGACVKAQGSVLGDGTRQAREVETRPAAECSVQTEFEFQGLVESAPAQGSSEWTISSIVVVVSGGTEIDERLGPLMVGACARVEGSPTAPNRVNARQIRVLSGSGVCASSASTVGGATLSAGAVSPNQVVSIFGPGVGPAGERNLEINDDRVARQLGANRVLFDGEAAPLLFLSSQQLNVITPSSLRGKTETEMQIETEGGWSQVIRLEVKALTPGLFTLNASGRGQAAALNTASDGSLSVNGAGNPIARGRVLVLYATGLGTANSGDDGLVVDPAGRNLPRLDAAVTVKIGGLEARVLYAGGAPGLVFGVWQLNLEVPPNVQPGQVSVAVEVNGETSPEGVFVVVE